jgi:hypothetical protein
MRHHDGGRTTRKRAAAVAALGATLLTGLALAGPSHAATLTLEPAQGRAGSRVVVRALEVACGTYYYGPPAQLAVRWDGVNVVGPVPAAARGEFDAAFVVPADAAVGTHTVELICIQSPSLTGINAPTASSLAQARFQVTPPPQVTTTTPSTTRATTPRTPNGSSPTTVVTTIASPTTTPGRPATTVPATTTTASDRPIPPTPPPTEPPRPGPDRIRSLVPDSVPDVTQISLDLRTIAAHMALALLLVLLLAFPAELFNKTWEENSDRIRAWFGRDPDRPSWWEQLPGPLTLGAFAVGAAVLYTLLDPNAGADRPTLALTLGLLVALVAITLAIGVPAAWVLRRLDGSPSALRTYPGAMAVAAFCVALSRLADFQPGYIYGVVAGYAVLRGSRGPDERDEGRSVATGALAVLALSLAAWLLWTPINRSLEGADGIGFGLLLADAILAAIFVAGLEGLTFGLVPLRFLDGAKITAWSRSAWFALHTLTMFGFVHVLLDPRTGLDPSSDAPVFTVVVLFLAFGAASVAFWGYFRLRRGREPAVT